MSTSQIVAGTAVLALAGYAISDFLENRKKRAPLREAVQQLSSSDAEQQSKGLEFILAEAKRNVSASDRVVDYGALHGMLKILSTEKLDEKVALRVLEGVSLCGSSAEGRKILRKNHGLASMVSMLDHPTPSVRTAAAKALVSATGRVAPSQRSEAAATVREICRGDNVEKLLLKIFGADAASQQDLLSILANCSSDPTVQKTLSEKKSVGDLMPLLRAGDAPTMAKILMIYRNLVIGRKEVRADFIANKEIIKTLLTAMQPMKAAQLSGEADVLIILHTLLSNGTAEQRKQLVQSLKEENGLRLLVICMCSVNNLVYSAAERLVSEIIEDESLDCQTELMRYFQAYQMQFQEAEQRRQQMSMGGMHHH